RAIVKREHRAGLHVSSYVAAHLIYQMILCALQALITIEVCRVMGVAYPAKGVIFEEFSPDLFITLFLITYSADVVALMISAIVHTPMAAMTVMPFVLIIQLVFAGFFSLPDRLEQVSDLMISRWGVQGICVLADYNELPAVLVWNSLVKNGATLEVEGVSLKDVLAIAEEEGMKDEILLRLGEANRRDDFASTAENLADCWIHLAIFTVVAAVITMFFLEFIDRDRR
ncbi:MAG: ABC transporter permease, partial [Lachnospiraceae bacterium]|nr:ABC transporter permease [Lachnospiraceae bacterium]